METHGILTLYATKPVEYVIALAYLLLFVPFFRYVSAGRLKAVNVRTVARRADDFVEWFRVAAGVAFHPGHAWVRSVRPGVALVGADDFTQRLVGRIEHLALPAVGTELHQGEQAWRLQVDGQLIDMLSPVDGVVTAVNTVAQQKPGMVNDDPYRSGWLLRVEGPRVDTSRKALLTGDLARRWIAQATDALRHAMSPDLGLALQDGGMPVDGLAQAIDRDRWTEIAREHLLS